MPTVIIYAFDKPGDFKLCYIVCDMRNDFCLVFNVAC